MALYCTSAPFYTPILCACDNGKDTSDELLRDKSYSENPTGSRLGHNFIIDIFTSVGVKTFVEGLKKLFHLYTLATNSYR
jgi:hypothetical protein